MLLWDSSIFLDHKARGSGRAESSGIKQTNAQALHGVGDSSCDAPIRQGALFARAHLPASLSYGWPNGCVRETGELIAIEVDRLSSGNFSTNTYAPGGHIIAQHRLLMARGWAVIHVPLYMWDRLSDAVRSAWLLQARRRLCYVCFRALALKRGQVLPTVKELPPCMCCARLTRDGSGAAA